MESLKVENVCKSFFVKNKEIAVNKDINLSVTSPSLVWIYGNSGAGKSTFLNLITGIDGVSKGKIFWSGRELGRMNADEAAAFRLENFGLIFQFFELIKAQSVWHNAAFPLKILRKSKKEMERILTPLFELFDLTPLIHKKPSELSGGEKQRVSIVRALAVEPKYLIADEITSSLDEKHSKQVYEYLRDYLKRKDGIGIFVSHDPIIKKYADKNYRMKDGFLSEEEYEGV